MRLVIFALVVANLIVGVVFSTSANSLRYSYQKDVNSLDPYQINESFTLGFLGNFYEGLVRRGPGLELEPALATHWEVIEPTRWRFHLRKGVKFHGGEDFTADDVIFSATRVRMDGSGLKNRLLGVIEVRKVDDFTVDFVTEAPNPILPAEWHSWYIMSKTWAEAHDAAIPVPLDSQSANYALTHVNGTGPFKLRSREKDARTIAEVYLQWWDEAKHNLTEVIFLPIANDATRVAAFLSGGLDMMFPVPPQNVPVIDRFEGAAVMTGPGLRTIFLGMNHSRSALPDKAKAANPFKDIRVRRAIYQAIDIDAIHEKVMRRMSQPTGELVAREIHGANPGKFKRLLFDPIQANSLLAAAGYSSGFEVRLDCVNDRYVNDEQICQAVAISLAKIGINVHVNAAPSAQIFQIVLPGDSNFYILGWVPGSYDSLNVLANLFHCPTDKGLGQYNLGGYCNSQVDNLIEDIQFETNWQTRDVLIEQAWSMVYDDVAYIPLHQQTLAWAVRDHLNVVQRADNIFSWRFVNIK